MHADIKEDVWLGQMSGAAAGKPTAADVILEAACGSGRGGKGGDGLTRQGAAELFGYVLDMPGGLAFQTLERVCRFSHPRGKCTK